MRRFLTALMIIGMLLVGWLIAPPAHAVWYHYEISIYSDTGFSTAAGGYTSLVSGVTYKVLADDTNTAATIYSDEGITAKTNPITTTVFAVDDKIDFYYDVATADIIIVDTAGGYTTYLDDATPYTRTSIIDEKPGILHHGCIWWAGTTTVDGTSTDTGIDFDIGTLIHNVMVELINPASTSQLLCVGIETGDTSGDHDGFINDMILSIDSCWINPMRVGISSAGTDDFIINATAGTPLGVLLGWIAEGTTSSANIDTGLLVTWPYLVNSNGQSLGYSVSSGTGATTDGYIHYFFTRMKWLDRSLLIYP